PAIHHLLITHKARSMAMALPVCRMRLLDDTGIFGVLVERPVLGNLVTACRITMHHHESIALTGMCTPFGVDGKEGKTDQRRVMMLTGGGDQNSQISCSQVWQRLTISSGSIASERSEERRVGKSVDL